jgi:hypothetical protein
MSRKAEWRKQAHAYLEKLLGLLSAYESVDSIRQESYKSAFFKVFADAYRSGFCWPGDRFDEATDRFVQCKTQRPLISGDAIWLFAKDKGWVRSEMPECDKRNRDIELLRTWWDEWVYAWNRHPPPRKYVRRKSSRPRNE